MDMGNEEQGTIPKPDATDEHREDAEGTGNEEQGTIPKPEVTDEHREQAKEMAKAYEDDRPTIGLPGTSNTVTGQAVADWVDDDGNPKFGEVNEGEGVKREDVMGVRKKNMGDED